MKRKLPLEPPGNSKRVLLHTCCAPCSAAIIEALLNAGITPVLFFYNPNIFPQAEYLLRKEECIRYATALQVEVIDGDYDHDRWLGCVAGKEHEPERGSRCLECFRMRLLVAARCASEQGISVLTTTLAGSRWKSLAQLEQAGLEACSHYPDVTFWAQNWKKGGVTERKALLMKEYNFYNQRYCGCEFSMPKPAAE